MDARIPVQREMGLNRWQVRLIWAALALMAVMVGFIGIDIAKRPAKIDGVVIYNRQSRGHDESLQLILVDLPPAGGPHHEIPQECGIYETPVEPERAIHSLEHGAVWVTYQPDLPAADIGQLQDIVRGQSYLLLSPFPGQRSPVVMTAWGVQLELSSVADDRIKQFISRYLLGPTTPELGAPCSAGLHDPLP